MTLNSKSGNPYLKIVFEFEASKLIRLRKASRTEALSGDDQKPKNTLNLAENDVKHKLDNAICTRLKMVDGLDPLAINVVHPKTILISSIKTLPDYLNQAVIHQKYVVEKLSVSQIAKQISSSKASVIEALKRFEIQARPKGSTVDRPTWAPYGKRYQNGQIVEHKRECQVLRTIIRPRYLRGDTLTSIVEFLNGKKIPTKRGELRWQTEQLRQILLREGIYKSKRKSRGSGKSKALIHKLK